MMAEGEEEKLTRSEVEVDELSRCELVEGL